jgi:hypothetical protein
VEREVLCSIATNAYFCQTLLRRVPFGTGLGQSGSVGAGLATGPFELNPIGWVGSGPINPIGWIGPGPVNVGSD